MARRGPRRLHRPVGNRARAANGTFGGRKRVRAAWRRRRPEAACMVVSAKAASLRAVFCARR